MKSERFEVTKEDAQRFEQALGQKGSPFKRLAILWEELLCKEFDPRAKKLVFLWSLILLSKGGIGLEYSSLKQRLVSAIIRVSKERPELLKTERWIRYAVTGN